MVVWNLWKPGRIQCEVAGITPVLASWDRSSHPSQVRLRTYLGEVVATLSPLPDGVPLFLHLDVDVGDTQRLLRHHDLENYLTPLFGSRWLPASKFALVSARKYVGGGSRIAWGYAEPGVPMDPAAWRHYSLNAGQGASQRAWKEKIRTGLGASCLSPAPAGPLRVRLGWSCSARRNWASLWKPTGDAMGAVLGARNPLRPYHVDDDRIVDLEFHRNVDNNLGHSVIVGMWWSAMPRDESEATPACLR